MGGGRAREQHENRGREERQTKRTPHLGRDKGGGQSWGRREVGDPGEQQVVQGGPHARATPIILLGTISAKTHTVAKVQSGSRHCYVQSCSVAHRALSQRGLPTLHPHRFRVSQAQRHLLPQA